MQTTEVREGGALMAEMPPSFTVEVVKDKSVQLLEFVMDVAKAVPTVSSGECSICAPAGYSDASGMCADCQLGLLQANARLLLREVAK